MTVSCPSARRPTQAVGASPSRLSHGTVCKPKPKSERRLALSLLYIHRVFLQYAIITGNVGALHYRTRRAPGRARQPARGSTQPQAQQGSISKSSRMPTSHHLSMYVSHSPKVVMLQITVDVAYYSGTIHMPGWLAGSVGWIHSPYGSSVPLSNVQTLSRREMKTSELITGTLYQHDHSDSHEAARTVRPPVRASESRSPSGGARTQIKYFR
jgi:hypothetical protein